MLGRWEVCLYPIIPSLLWVDEIGGEFQAQYVQTQDEVKCNEREEWLGLFCQQHAMHQ